MRLKMKQPHQSGVNASQIRSLAGLDFIGSAENLVFIGPPGTGKTGDANGLARKAATIITTNLDYESCYQLFKRKPLVDALLDRLKHHCITLEINGPSLKAPLTSPQKEIIQTRQKRQGG